MGTTTTNYTFGLPTLNGDEDSWGTQLNANWTKTDALLSGGQDLSALSVTTSVTLKGQGDLILSDADSSHSVSLQAAATIGTSYTLTLPAADGTDGQALVTDGSGALSFATIAGSEFTAPTVVPDGTVKTLTVKVVTKTTSHPYYNVGSTLGFEIDDVEAPFIELIVGNTYRFDQSDSSNASHPLRLYYDVGKNRAYTTNVTTAGTAGSAGAYTEISVTEATPRVLFYQCSAHGNMGFYLSSATDNNYGFSEVTTTAPTSGANYPTGYVWYVVS